MLFVSFFVCSNKLVSRVRVPVVFYLNISKKGKKQDVNDHSFESHVKDCLETIHQDVETTKNNKAKFKEDSKTVKQKLKRTTECGCVFLF